MFKQYMEMEPVGLIRAGASPDTFQARWRTLAKQDERLRPWPLDLGVSPWTHERVVLADSDVIMGVVGAPHDVGLFEQRHEGLVVRAQAKDFDGVAGLAAEIAKALEATFVTAAELEEE